MHTRNILPLLFILVFLYGCANKKSPVEPPEDNGDNNGSTIVYGDTANAVKMPQTDIPWPSLADSPWPMFLHDPQHTSRSPYAGPQQGSYEVFAGTNHAEVFSSPAIAADGSILFGADGVYRLDAAGETLWHYNADPLPQIRNYVQTSPLITSDGTVYVGSQTGTLYALRHNGTLKWSFDTGMVFGFRSPAISPDGGTIYVDLFAGGGVMDYRLMAIDSSGQKRWEYEITPPGYGNSSPALSPDGQVIYVTAGGVLHAVNANGSPRWTYAAQGESGIPAVDNQGNIYFNSGGTLYAVNPNGTARWSQMIQSDFTAPCIGHDGTIYSYGGQGLQSLYRFDYEGKLIWKSETSGMPLGCSSPSVDMNGSVYLGLVNFIVTEEAFNFIALSSNGQIIFNLGMRGPGGMMPDIDTSPVISNDGSIYTGSDAGEGWYVFKIN